mmetsp:Transcript_8939/g.17997  ORF Transcript_8939/g.17997 Transcript_8939/m.17997 type:complete len:86 (+) Transcript_8939:287-544(+)
MSRQKKLGIGVSLLGSLHVHEVCHVRTSCVYWSGLSGPNSGRQLRGGDAICIPRSGGGGVRSESFADSNATGFAGFQLADAGSGL